MANARFETTFSFARHRADARIVCPCGHARQVAPALLLEWFPMPVPIRDAERRLLCTRCRQRGRARMVPVPHPSR